jgi:hypothetical protein
MTQYLAQIGVESVNLENLQSLQQNLGNLQQYIYQMSQTSDSISRSIGQIANYADPNYFITPITSAISGLSKDLQEELDKSLICTVDTPSGSGTISAACALNEIDTRLYELQETLTALGSYLSGIDNAISGSFQFVSSFLGVHGSEIMYFFQMLYRIIQNFDPGR